MNINTVEKLTGMSRANIRFYEKYGLLNIQRDNENNYREYSENDVNILNKIKFLRCIGISLAEIKSMILQNEDISVAASKRLQELKNEISEFELLSQICTTLSHKICLFNDFDTNSYVINKDLLEKRNQIIMKLDYDIISERYDTSKKANLITIDYFIDNVNITYDSCVLDFGSGTGNHAIALQQATNSVVYGVDSSDGMREKALAKNSNVKFIKGDHNYIPLENETVDFIYMTDVIHHIPDLSTMFFEFIRILKKHGKICIATESHKQLETRSWVRFFPSTVDIEKKRYPDIIDIVSVAESCGLKHLKTDISDEHKSHKIDKAFVDLVETKGFSMFELINYDDYVNGLKMLKNAYESQELLESNHGESFVWFEKKQNQLTPTIHI